MRVKHPYLAAKGVAPHGLRITTRDYDLPCPESGKILHVPAGALVAPLCDPKGEIHSLEFIWPDRKKRFLPGGAKRGHFFTIGELTPTICIAEGVATGASVHEATGYQTIVAFDAGNLLSVALVIRAKHPRAKIVICADNDVETPGNPGVTAATRAAKAIRGLVGGAHLREGDHMLSDFNDKAAEGPEAVKAGIDAATPVDGAADAPMLRALPEIIVGTDEARVVDEAIAALAMAPEVYARGPELVEIVTDTPATRGVTRSGPRVRIHRLPEARVRELLADRARWMATGRDGESLVDAHPPLWAVKAVMARGHYPTLRQLVAVAEAPTMRPDGTILDKAGYDPPTGIFLSPSVCVSISDRPTRDDAVAACALLADVIAEFPVATDAGRSAWISGVVTVAARPAIDGPTPALIVDATDPGSGKTLVADAGAVIATGRPAPRTTFVADDAEMEKRITAIALEGDPLVLLDNVAGSLGCPSLDAALTGTTWRGRVLGSSAMTAELPLRTVWWATGNRLVIGADLVRRALLIQLEPLCEHPEERTGFRYPRLLEHVREHRSELLGAALTIVRAYVVAGRPDQRLTPMGSYTAWSDLIRSALVWAGLADPCGTIAEIRASDPRADAFRAVIESWPAAPDVPVMVAELLAAATPGTPWRAALTEWCPVRGADPLPNARALGFRLRGVRRRVMGGRCVDAGPHGRGGVPWVLRVTGSPTRPNRDDVTTVTMVSRYAWNEEIDKSSNSGGDSHERHTVTDAVGQNAPPTPAADAIDPLETLSHCLRVRPTTTASDADREALAAHFRTLNGKSEATAARLFDYWRKAPAPTVGAFLATETRAQGRAS